MKEKNASVGIKWGLILGGILAAFNIIMYTVDITLFVNTAVNFLPTITIVVIGVLVAKEYKATNEGFGSFGDIFKNTFFAFAIGVFISILIQYILFHFIDPDVGEQIKELKIEKAVDLIERFGVELPEEALDKMDETDPFTLKNLISSFVTVTFGNILLGLIIAAFTKNEKPEFE